jgi:hypothetical protein
MAGRGSLAKLGNPVSELEAAARERLLDAEALLSAGRFASSIAFGLYALEIELKVVICRRLDLEALPIIFQTHDRKGLLMFAGLSKKIKRVKRPLSLKKNWDELIELPEIDTLRYTHDPRWDEPKARRVLQLLCDKNGGVIPWVKKQKKPS